MAQPRSENLALALIVTMEVPNFFSKELPSRMTVARFASAPSDLRMLRMGEIKAATYSVILGAAASWLDKSWLPLIGTAVMSALMVRDTEQAIREASQNPDAAPINAQPVGGIRLAGNGGTREFAAGLKTRPWTYAPDIDLTQGGEVN